MAIGLSMAMPAAGRMENAAPPFAEPPPAGEKAVEAAAADSLTRAGKDILWHALQWGDLHRVVLAESCAYHALEIDSAYVPALNLMSRALSAEGRFEDVLYVQNWAIVCELRNPESWGILGDAFMDLGKYRDADSCYTRMAHVGGDLRSRMRMARWAFELGDPDSALAHMSEAIEIGEGAMDASRRGGGEGTEPVGESPGDARRDLAEAYVRQGTMLLARGRYEEAHGSVGKSLAAVPGFVPALALEADLLRLEGRYGESIRIYERLVAASLDPAFESALAGVHAEKSRSPRTARLVADAKRNYKRRLAEFPKATRSEYAAFLLDWNLDTDQALALAYEESRRRRGVESYDLLARAYYKKRTYDLAWSSISLALRSGTRDPRILYHAALIAKANGDEEKHVSCAGRARQINPKCDRQYGSF
jgi:tetratricopeptide (TPR) repeat protein